MFRVIIAGTRYFNDYAVLKEYCNYILSNKIRDKEEITILSGGAKGADALGERYAAEKGFSIIRYPAQWEKYGAAAGPKRNKEMCANADALIAFWDGQSRGTRNVIEEAEKKGLKVAVRYYNS